MASNSSSRRIQGIFVACLVLLGACTGVGSTLLALRWQADRSDRTAFTLLNQNAQLFSQGLLNRKRTLEILRDTLEKGSRLSEQERREIVQSASGRLPHLEANGWINSSKEFAGWTSPGALSSQEMDRLTQEALRRSGWRRWLGLTPSFTWPREGGRFLWVFAQPLDMPGARGLVSASDVDGLFADLTRVGSQPSPALRVTQNGQTIYRSKDWRETGPGQESPAVLERTIRLDGTTWLLEAQTKTAVWAPPGGTGWIFLAVALLIMLALCGMVWAAGRLRHLATTDELTSLNNRRFFLERWQEEVERAKRYRRDLSCLIIDVNGFKRINDRSGHLIGDAVLRQAAEGLRRQLRRTDVLARFGGDEFIVALPETGLDQALRVAEKIRSIDFNDPPAASSRDRVGPVMLSAGAAQLQGNEPPLDVIERADQDLYASRRGAPQVSKILDWMPEESRSAAP